MTCSRCGRGSAVLSVRTVYAVSLGSKARRIAREEVVLECGFASCGYRFTEAELEAFLRGRTVELFRRGAELDGSPQLALAL